MSIQQRDIVRLRYHIPGEEDVEEHPWIIISNQALHDTEQYFIAVMMSGTKREDFFSFPVDSSMFTAPLKKPGQIRCNVITLFDKDDIIGTPLFKMKETPFERMIDNILNFVFETD